ncbi:unnamed protein product [Arctogadus glacialis]
MLGLRHGNVIVNEPEPDTLYAVLSESLRQRAVKVLKGIQRPNNSFEWSQGHSPTGSPVFLLTARHLC